MKVFTRDYSIKHYDSPLWGEYFNGLKPCVLDIEATGLDPQRCKLVLMGLLTETESGLRVTQFLAENHYEENRVLEATMKFLHDEGIDYIITFNGLRYDVPFINTRLHKLGYEDEMNIYAFDLYRFLRKCSVLPDRMDSLSQASVERYFGIASDRKDTISGRESVALFDEYAVTGNSTIEKIILTHNREDVLQLYKLLMLAGNDDFDELLKNEFRSSDCKAFHAAIAKYGFPICNGGRCARPSLNTSKMTLRISGDQISDPVTAAYYPDIDSSVSAVFNAVSRSYEISFPIEKHNSECFVDLSSLGLSGLRDSDAVGRYLILNPRTINVLARELVAKYQPYISE